MTANIEEICQKAVKLWGSDLQLNMVIEEASELIKAICKLKRKNGSFAEEIIAVMDVAEEIADLEIMIEQLKVMLCCHMDVESWKERKIKRLKQMVEETGIDDR